MLLPQPPLKTLTAAPTRPEIRSRRTRTSFRFLCLVVFIIALLLSLLRGLILVFSVIGAATISSDDPIAPTIWGEIATGALTFLGGVIGYGAMLAKQRWGSYFAWASLLGVVGSITVGMFQVPLILETQGSPDQTATLVGMWIGVGVVALVRLSIGMTCAIAIVQFLRWHRRQECAF